ncbi:ADP-heptose--LPS heptosyltransferase 2 [Candidatus Magnetaquicoccaceae bacterium FCR-1]|uniref:lipopolysaccharide heptosyltransferase II n=2 Tax=Candidatus Magnetaquiglobus chichijimensis TaxID=3141448 RepID=A0ABQ0C5R7_9PROT
MIGPSWVGDMVMAQSLFMVLKQERPERPIDLVAPTWALPLAARMPEIRHAIALPAGHGELALAARYRVGISLRGRHAQAILLPNSLKSALVPWFARIPRRTGFLGELRFGLVNDIRTLDKQRLPRTVQRFVALGLPRDTPLPDSLPVPRLRASVEEGERILGVHGLCAEKKLLALCPGAEYGPAKRWPVRHFAALARARIASGWRVAVLGSAKERTLGAEILAGLTDAKAIDPSASGGRDLGGTDAVNLAGAIDLVAAIDVLACAEAVVSNDSGLMHVAAALDRPGVAIFGSSDPGHTPPLGTSMRIVSLGLACAPCFKRVCPEGAARCLEEITPERVLESL